MLKTSSLARSAVAAAALCIAGSAFAEGTFTPDLGVGYGSGKQIGIPGDRQTYTLNFAFGYADDSGFGARAVVITDGNLVRGFLATDRSFDNFIGAEATWSVPLQERVKLTGGLGIGRSKLDDGDGNSSPASTTITDGLLSLGLQYKFTRHYAMELRVSHLTSSGVTSTTLQAQIPF